MFNYNAWSYFHYLENERSTCKIKKSWDKIKNIAQTKIISILAPIKLVSYGNGQSKHEISPQVAWINTG